MKSGFASVVHYKSLADISEDEVAVCQWTAGRYSKGEDQNVYKHRDIFSPASVLTSVVLFIPSIPTTRKRVLLDTSSVPASPCSAAINLYR